MDERLKLISKVVTNYQQYSLTEAEVTTLVQLLTIDAKQVDFESYLQIPHASQKKLIPLFNKKIITLKETELGVIIYLDLQPKPEDEFAVSAGMITKIGDMVGYKLNPNQISQVVTWLQTGIDFTQIEEAIIIGKTKGITKFEYIAAIVNNGQKMVENDNRIIRNWKY